jgi:hypothetical protein
MSESRKDNKKGGFWASLLNLFGKGSSSSGGAARFGLSGSGFGTAGSGFGTAGSGFGTASGFSGLFGSKAGLMGMILGAATMAAGIGVIYNLVGQSSNDGSAQHPFQDTYYEDQAQNAALERAKQKGYSASDSTLDMFKDQAKKDGLGFDEQDGKEDASAEDAKADKDAKAGEDGASAVPSANAPGAGGGGKLQAAPSFGSGGAIQAGSGGSSGGGSSSVNGKNASAGSGGSGESSSMKGALASAIKSSPKRSVPVSNKKGALGQAKFARAVGNKAANSGSAVASKTGATEAFTGETAGAGDVAPAGAGGAGLDGAGITNGSNLKSSDPSLDSSNSTPPEADTTPEDVSPWTKYTNMAMYAMLAAAVLIFIAGYCTKKAALLASNPATMALAAAWYGYAQLAAYAAMAAAAVVIYAGYVIKQTYGQKWTGLLYMAAGAILMWKAYEALTLASDGADKLTPEGLGDKVIKADPGPVPGSGAGTKNWNDGIIPDSTDTTTSNNFKYK